MNQPLVPGSPQRSLPPTHDPHSRRRSGRRRATGMLAALISTLALLAGVLAAPSATASPEPSTPSWTGTWGAAAVDQSGSGDCNPCTIRNTVHTSIGGGQLRLVLTNALGTVPLKVESTTVSLPAAFDSPDALPESITPVTFDGDLNVTVPAGEEVTSDPVDFQVRPNSDLQVSSYFTGNARLTKHSFGTRKTSYVWRDNQDKTSQAQPGTTNLAGPYPDIYALSEVDVRPDDQTPAAAGSVVLVGDSITDGTHSTEDADARWSNLLAQRILDMPAADQLGVINAAISGNRILQDGTGPSAVSRFQRDVLDRNARTKPDDNTPGTVRSVVFFEGINDIRQLPDPVGSQGEDDVADLTNELATMADKARSHGIRPIGATIVPWGGYGAYNAAREDVRQEVNHWIRATDVFESVIDFDAVIRDPEDKHQMRPDFNSGDNLHPNAAGYQAMANAVDLAQLGGYDRPGTVDLSAPHQVIRGTTTHIAVRVTADHSVDDASVHFTVPAGWRFDAAPTVDLGSLDAGQSAVASLQVLARTPAGQTDADILVSASLDGQVTSAAQPVRTLSPVGPRDTTPPTTTVTVDPEQPAATGWYRKPVTVSATATDNSDGFLYIEHRIDQGPWLATLGPITAPEGNHTIQVRSVDGSENTSPTVTRTIKVDTRARLKKLKVKATKKVRKKGYRPHHKVKVKVKVSKKLTDGRTAKGKVKLRVKQHGSFTTVKKKNTKKFRKDGGKLKLKIAKRYVHGKKLKVKAVYQPKKAWRSTVKKKKQKIVLHRR